MTFPFQVSLTSVVLVDVAGLDRLTSAFGLLVSFRGVSSVLGPPLAGAVIERSKDGSCDLAFYLSGACYVAAGVISLVAMFAHKIRGGKANKLM